MDEFVYSIFKNAILREQLAQKMYLDLSEKAKTKTLKELFLNLALEERIHEDLFNKLNLNTIKIVNRIPLSNLNLLNNTKKSELFNQEINEINNALDYAINEEENAFKDYNLLINHLEFGDVRETFQEMARQEKRHKILLQKVKLEFNDNDWNFISKKHTI